MAEQQGRNWYHVLISRKHFHASRDREAMKPSKLICQRDYKHHALKHKAQTQVWKTVSSSNMSALRHRSYWITTRLKLQATISILWVRSWPCLLLRTFAGTRSGPGALCVLTLSGLSLSQWSNLYRESIVFLCYKWPRTYSCCLREYCCLIICHFIPQYYLKC